MRVISSRWLRPCPLYTPPVATTDWMARWGLRTGPGRSATTTQGRKVGQTRSFRGSKSRNKVSVGEPAEGSLPFVFWQHHCELYQAGGVKSMRTFFKWFRPAPLVQPFVYFYALVVSCMLLTMLITWNRNVTTSNGGSLGSCIDEERSQLR